MESVICIVGDNLKSVHEVWFNDQQAALNTSYMTDHTLIVAVPPAIPEEVTNKIYFKTASGKVVDYDFNVLVPQPVIYSMNNEWAAPGEEVTLTGNYFCDDPNIPIEVILPGNITVTEFSNVTLNSLTFVMPEEATIEGAITVKSLYGTGRSSFYYRDSRGMLFDWDGDKGLSIGHGWRSGEALIGVRDDIPALNGNYICFDGKVTSAWPDEDKLSFNYWPEPAAGFPALSTMFDVNKFADMSLKFEVYIPSTVDWNTNSLNVIFTGDDHVTYATGNNAYIGDDGVTRFLWTPWRNAEGQSYNTGDRWITVTAPLSQFTLTRYGAACANPLNVNHFTGLTFIVYAGYFDDETECNLVMAIDNIRVVPNY